MNYIESFKSAIQSIRGNKIRSFLTMLGIIIGISSVITMSSIGKGGQENIIGDLKNGGYGKFNISIDSSDENFRWKYLLNEKIIEKLKENEEFVGVSPKIATYFTFRLGKSPKREFLYTEIETPDYKKIEKVTLLYGREILPIEYENADNVIMIDNITARDIFGNPRDAIGKNIELNRGRKENPRNYRIVGVFRNEVENVIKVMGGGRVPRFARMPLTTYQKIFDPYGKNYTSLIVEVKNPEIIGETINDTKNLLERITGEKNLYSINLENNGAESFDKILTTLNMFVTFVASISLFVGGIGVMNIMLVSVVERTKEIGIRKAIGATNFDILLQFLMESIILTGIGGISGIVIGIVFALGIGRVIGIAPIFSVVNIVVALMVSMGIGIIFGVAPARKASKLNPIEALRSE